jgi:tagatose 1,6-diphosphate aldolase/sulfofructosephosphate aldolase
MSFSLDQIAGGTGRFAILAMDQRGTLRKMLDKAGTPSADADMSAFKVDVIGRLSPHASGVLTDVEYGVAPVREAGALAAGVGLLIASEWSPQPQWNGESRNEFDRARGPDFVAANGGAALKFLVRWRPDRPARAGEPDLAQEAVDAVRAVVEACRAYGLPSVIEPLVNRQPGDDHALSKQLVIRSAEVLAELGPDLLKLEWPGDADGCHQLTKVCGNVPWALLSAGVAYEQFVDRVLVAMDAGATGYIAGRAFWGEAAGLTGTDRRRFLQTTGAERMAALNTMVEGHGRSWREVAGR